MAKSAEAFRTISEAAEELGVAQHVLRFWETKFSFIRPMKSAGGRRFYRPADIATLAALRRLLHREGYTIKGVQKLHREQGLSSLLAGNAAEPAPSPASPKSSTQSLREALAELEIAKARLDGLLFRA